MHSTRGRPARLVAVAAAGATALALIALPATADPGGDEPSVPRVDGPAAMGTPFTTIPVARGATAPRTQTVTLITGDTVTVSTTQGKTSVTAAHRDGEVSDFGIITDPDGDQYVYPQQALPGIRSGLLDRELFNITTLTTDGYDDASMTELPVIVEYADAVPTSTLAARAESLPASADAVALTSINGAGLAVDKDDAGTFFDTLDAGIGPQSRAARQIDRVWLDSKIEVALEESVPQIGAPDAWAKGFDGTGVTVGVLDTGVDAGHPDLVGKLAATQSFVSGEDVADGHGHGTHVAATIAGSGAAANGLRPGVAPGAELLIGKVLGNDGSGMASGIIQGMEWAAESGADVISMSLGGDTGSAEDVLTYSVDTLTEQYGALFVIAAGNSGPREMSIGSPGTARSALTVGAVDTSDQLASFSSRGPRVEDYGIKPEITAPGVGIVAARAAGTSLGTVVDEYYTSLNGTSMATPHVAGAAAIFKQQHPDLTPEQLKNALVSTAKNAPGLTGYQQGSGRVDLTAATAATVFASATADFAAITPNPDSPNPPVSRTVTYTNAGAADVTLDLDLTLDRAVVAVDGEISLSGDTVTVPAGGTAQVDITLAPGIGELGQHSGYLSATAAGVVLTTAVGYVRREPEVPVTITGIDRAGEDPRTISVQLFSLDRPDMVYRNLASGTLYGLDGTVVASVPKGRYGVHVIVNSAEPVVFTDKAVDFYTEPELLVDGATTLTVDARQAVDIEGRIVDEKRPLEPYWSVTSINRVFDDGTSLTSGSMSLDSDDNGSRGVIGSGSTTTVGSVKISSDIGLRDPLMTAEIDGRHPEALDIVLPLDGYRGEGTITLPAVSVGAGGDEDYQGVDVAGKLAVISTVTGYAGALTGRAEANGAAAVMLVRPVDGVSHVYTNGTVPIMAATYQSGRRLLERMAAGPADVTLRMQAESRFTYLLPASWEGDSLPSQPMFTASKAQFARVENSFHSDGMSRKGQEQTFSWHPWQATSYRTPNRLYSPAVRDEFFYAPQVHYQQHVSSGMNAVRMSGRVVAYGAGSRSQQDWLRAPYHQGVTPAPCGFCRTDTQLTFGYTPFADSDPTHFGTGPATSVAGRFYRDGVQVTGSELMVPEPAEYRYEYDLTRRLGPGDDLATQTNTAWTFRSSGPTTVETEECSVYWSPEANCSRLPVILTGYDVPLDLLNRARAGRPMNFDLRTARPDGFSGEQRITGATVLASYDDGATWEPATVRLGDAGTHRVKIRHPQLAATNGFVALKVAVWDDAGNRTTQTILRAYALR